MELPHLGQNCSEKNCKKLDFLPIKCDACQKIFCNDHYHYASHDCPNAHLKDIQVPACPLCGKPIPIPRGQKPDIIVGAHIDRDCQSDTANGRRNDVYKNKCSVRGCKVKELIPVICPQCHKNFCLKHRHQTDHGCESSVRKSTTAAHSRAAEAALSRFKINTNKLPNPDRHQRNSTIIPENMSEDEALAKAIALSLQDTPGHFASNEFTQDHNDAILARALAESESEAQRPSTNQGKDRCCLS